MDRAVLHMDNSYNIPNIRGIGVVCKTNLASNTAFRGFGGPQGMMVAECWMSEIALKCGLSAEEVRAHRDIILQKASYNTLIITCTYQNFQFPFMLKAVGHNFFLGVGASFWPEGKGSNWIPFPPRL